MRKIAAFLLVLCVWAMPALSVPREVRIPLEEGEIHTGQLSKFLMEKLHLPNVELLDKAAIDVSGLRGSLFILAINESLGDGCRISVTQESLVLHFDAEKLPQDFDAAKKAARIFTAVAAPKATADQQRLYGLLLPEIIVESKPMIVLVHGMDSDRANWSAMAQLLQSRDYQVAYFTYPSDQPLADSAELLAASMVSLRESFPTLPLNLLAHSMGGLIARAYVEGDHYAGGVEHLILIAPPNQGSKWTRYRLLLEIQEHYHLWRHEPNWQPSWIITDGLGEAGRDLKPDSEFLGRLNALPRRENVKYTIIAGSQHPAARITSNIVEASSHWIPNRAAKWWGIRQTRAGLQCAAAHIRETGKSDGPVNIDSAKLEGVGDFVLLPADHGSLYLSLDGRPPLAWESIQDRLSK